MVHYYSSWFRQLWLVGGCCKLGVNIDNIKAADVADAASKLSSLLENLYTDDLTFQSYRKWVGFCNLYDRQDLVHHVNFLCNYKLQKQIFEMEEKCFGLYVLCQQAHVASLQHSIIHKVILLKCFLCCFHGASCKECSRNVKMLDHRYPCVEQFPVGNLWEPWA